MLLFYLQNRAGWVAGDFYTHPFRSILTVYNGIVSAAVLALLIWLVSALAKRFIKGFNPARHHYIFAGAVLFWLLNYQRLIMFASEPNIYYCFALLVAVLILLLWLTRRWWLANCWRCVGGVVAFLLVFVVLTYYQAKVGYLRFPLRIKQPTLALSWQTRIDLRYAQIGAPYQLITVPYSPDIIADIIAGDFWREWSPLPLTSERIAMLNDQIVFSEQELSLLADPQMRLVKDTHKRGDNPNIAYANFFLYNQKTVSYFHFQR